MSYVGSIIFGFVLLVVGAMVAAWLPAEAGSFRLWFFGLFGFYALIDWVQVALNVISSEYFVSSKRIFIKRGILSRASHDLKIEWMTGTVVRQGLFGRVLNFGDVVFTGVGLSGNVKMNGVFDVLNVKEIVENVIQSNKEQAAAAHPSPTQVQSSPVPSKGSKFCQFCGARMPSPAVFCPGCGKLQL